MQFVYVRIGSNMTLIAPAEGPHYELPQLQRLPYAVESDGVRMFEHAAREWAQRTMPQVIEAAELNFHEHMVSRLKPRSDTNPAVPLQYPHQFMLDAGKQGFLSLNHAESHGGLAPTNLEQVAFMEELARVDAGLALKMLAHTTLSSRPISIHGTDAQKNKYLPGMASGDITGCFALSEPGIGSDAMNLQCKAVKVDGGWEITGRKIWVTNANGAAEKGGVMVGAFRTGEADSGADGISTLLVEMGPDKEGIEVTTIPKHGQHGSQFCEIAFDHHFVPDDALLGEENGGKVVLRDTLSHSRWWIAAQGTGVAMHAYDEAVKHAAQLQMYKNSDGSPKYLIELELAQRNLSHMKREIDIARLLVRKAAYEEEIKSKYAHVWASIAKVVAGEVCFLAGHDAQLMFGAMGYTLEGGIGTVATDADPIRIYEGAREVQIELIASHLMADKQLLAEGFAEDDAQKLNEERQKAREQLRLVWPILDKPLVDVETLPPVEEVMAQVETWEMGRKRAA